MLPFVAGARRDSRRCSARADRPLVRGALQVCPTVPGSRGDSSGEGTFGASCRAGPVWYEGGLPKLRTAPHSSVSDRLPLRSACWSQGSTTTVQQRSPLSPAIVQGLSASTRAASTLQGGPVRPATASANRNNDSNHHETIIESPGCSTNAGAPLHSSSAQCAGASTLGLPRGRRGQGLGLISQAAGAAPARPRRGPASLTSSAPQAL